MKLYEATEALAIIDELLEESGGEITPEIEELMEKAEGDFDTKAVRVALKIRELRGAAEVCTSQAKALEAEPARLKKRGKTFENAADRLLEYLEREMRKAGREAKPLKHELVTLKFDKVPDAIEIDDKNVSLEALCESKWKSPTGVAYVTPTIGFELDKKLLLADVKAAVAEKRDHQLPKGFTFLTGRTTLRLK